MCCLMENLFHNSLIIYYYLTLQYMKKNLSHNCNFNSL